MYLFVLNIWIVSKFSKPQHSDTAELFFIIKQACFRIVKIYAIYFFCIEVQNLSGISMKKESNS